jgi:4-hydroxy-3-methylbut-2-en-1-yl diphosphate reductase
MTSTYFRKGFGLKAEIEGQLASDYSSAIVDAFRANEYRLEAGPLTFRLAREFGFCYGVDRAVEYAYETRKQFPDKRIVLVGEIIHNPHVNAKLISMGIIILARAADGSFDFTAITPQDVVLLPAFGVPVADFKLLRDLGCILVDTTCGSVLNVWKRVDGYARDGYTAIIHGKYYHEETRATASQVTRYPTGKYLVVFDMEEARAVCEFIEGRGDSAAMQRRFSHACSPGFDWEQDLARVGLANQTTMLSGESLAIAQEVRRSMIRRYGEETIAEHFRTFDTICSATQERQDAVLGLLAEKPDLMIVVGGYNSSNTAHLAALGREHGVRTYHVEDASAIDVETGTLRYQPGVKVAEEVTDTWLDGVQRIGLTAGASTPNNKIGEAVLRICAVAGVVPTLNEKGG